MPGGERAYAYAKACGIIGKSFIGKRLSGLQNVTRLSELDRTIFPASSRDMPEKELLVDLEGRIIDRAVKSIITIVGCFPMPPEFLILLIRGYEYADLQNALASFPDNEKSPPAHTELGSFGTVRFSAWPDIRAMIEGTAFGFLLDKNGKLKEEGITLQTTLDRHYYSALWKSLSSLSRKDRYAAEKILADEISLKNSCWALRLRTYYEMPLNELKNHLIDIRVAKPGRRSLADEATDCLEFPLDDVAAWSSWRWKQFLNPVQGGEAWRADPRYFQNAASRHLYRLAKRYFRMRPFSLDSVFCFIKLKQFEEDVLTSNAEGLGMGMSSRDVISVLGVAE